MKKLKIVRLKQILPVFLLSLVSSGIYAQKLPAVQQISMRVPGNPEISGKIAEWNSKFQAYNKSVDLFYTIANNDNNLYLTIRATDKNIIYKIINGGITFTVNTSGKKNDKDGATITYPKFSRKNWPVINLDDKPLVRKGSTISSKQVDSFRYAINKQLDKAREIEVSGIQGINDLLISIYNNYGIKAAHSFDNQITYIYELAIPLKYLGFTSADSQKIRYNVKINPILSSLPKNVVITEMVVKASSMGALAPTDFWGEYTLAKK